MSKWKMVGLGMVGAFLGVMLLAGMAFWADIFKVDSNGVVYLRVTDNGNVGIGANSPGSRLVVQGTGTTSSSSSLNVTASDGTSRFFVRDDGYVGIGTTSPATKLDITGNMKLNGGLVTVSSLYTFTGTATQYIADSEITREGMVIVSVDGNSTPGSAILQIYRWGTFNDVSIVAHNGRWASGATSEPATGEYRAWIENNSNGGRLAIKHTYAWGDRNLRVYSLGTH